jgi:four helix bundle protein
MTKEGKMPEHPRNLIQRTFEFAQSVRSFVNRLPRLPSNFEDARQVIRSSGSVAANYLEAQEGLSRRDFFYRIKICRKEARESGLWLQLLIAEDAALIAEKENLVCEANELKRIFSAIAGIDDTQEQA